MRRVWLDGNETKTNRTNEQANWDKNELNAKRMNESNVNEQLNRIECETNEWIESKVNAKWQQQRSLFSCFQSWDSFDCEASPKTGSCVQNLGCGANTHIQNFATTVHGATIFSKLDLGHAYHEIPVKPSYVPKTAMITPFGLFEFLWVPFGLWNAA